MVMRVKVKLAPSGIHGLGLFAAEPIAAGSTVWCWDEGVDVRLPLDARDGQDVVPEVPDHVCVAWRRRAVALCGRGSVHEPLGHSQLHFAWWRYAIYCFA